MSDPFLRPPPGLARLGPATRLVLKRQQTLILFIQGHGCFGCEGTASYKRIITMIVCPPFNLLSGALCSY